jgi:hypothetical protein
MKHLFFAVVVCALISCQEKNAENLFFKADKIEELNLDNLFEFYETEKLTTYASPFKNFVGYVGGIGYENSEKGIFVSVFESEDKAKECMEDRIRTVSCIIKIGTSEILEHPWWFSDCGARKSVYKNQWNTIIEISYSSSESFEKIQDLLINTTKEVAKRVNDLSDY